VLGKLCYGGVLSAVTKYDVQCLDVSVLNKDIANDASVQCIYCHSSVCIFICPIAIP